MYLTEPARNLLTQLKGMLEHISTAQYALPLPILSGASIGQHVRHIIELFMELDKGYVNGNVDYESRKRDYRMETDPAFANLQIDFLAEQIEKTNKILTLSIDSGNELPGKMLVETNYFRELIYNTDHTVHHMALIRIGINQICDVQMPDSFGVAASTIKYRQSKAAKL